MVISSVANMMERDALFCSMIHTSFCLSGSIKYSRQLAMRNIVESFELTVKPGLGENKQAQTQGCLMFRQLP